jgi:ribosomal-protein-alanine N-acetyltransferase
MTFPPTVTTERLVLEPLSQRHSAGMHRLWSHPAVSRYAGPALDWNGDPIRLPTPDAAESDRIIDYFVRSAAAGRGFRWAVIAQDNGAFAGAVGFNILSPRAEMGYHLHPDFWGRGLMREAAQAALAWVRRERPGGEIAAFIEPGNQASIGLATRLGFRPTGVFKETAEAYVLGA